MFKENLEAVAVGAANAASVANFINLATRRMGFGIQSVDGAGEATVEDGLITHYEADFTTSNDAVAKLAFNVSAVEYKEGTLVYEGAVETVDGFDESGQEPAPAARWTVDVAVDHLVNADGETDDEADLEKERVLSYSSVMSVATPVDAGDDGGDGGE